MNRLQLIAHAPETTSQTDEQLDNAGLSLPPDVAYDLFAPLHYEPKYAYPLLVWLHGPHGDEHELSRVIPEISMRNYVGVGPRGNLQMEDSRGYRWDDADENLSDAEQHVFDAIDAASQRYNVAANRVFLAGFEGGGTMAFRIGLRNPDCFAGVMSIGGPFPLGGAPLGKLGNARKLPFFIAQGRESENYPIELACEELRLFHTAGLGVTVRQYPCGDEVDTQMLKDMDTWIMEHVTGTTSAEPPTYFLGDAG
jgi:phospholipase/carboxylesterase